MAEDLIFKTGITGTDEVASKTESMAKSVNSAFASIDAKAADTSKKLDQVSQGAHFDKIAESAQSGASKLVSAIGGIGGALEKTSAALGAAAEKTAGLGPGFAGISQALTAISGPAGTAAKAFAEVSQAMAPL